MRHVQSLILLEFRMFPIRRALAAALVLAVSPFAAADEPPQVLKSATWFSPGASAWGLYTVDQGSVLGAYWFTYDENGKPTWFMGVTTPQQNGNYSGEVLRFTGVPYAQIVGQAHNPPSRIGRIDLSFDDDGGMDFTFTEDEKDGESLVLKYPMIHFPFGDRDIACEVAEGSRAQATNYTDMWWSPDSSGWGVHLSHLDTDLFATWYTYDTDGRGVFMIGSPVLQEDGSYQGKLYRQISGEPYKSTGSPAQDGREQEIGTVALRFIDGEHARFTYTIGNVTQTKDIQRFAFGNKQSVCKVVPYQSPTTGGGNGGDPAPAGEECYPPYRIGDVRTLRSTSTSNGTTSPPHQYTETIVGNATFNGQSGFRQEVYGPTSGATGVYSNVYLGNGDNSIASFGAEALDPANGQIISTSRNNPSRVESPRYFQNGETVVIDFKVNSTSAAGNGLTEIHSTFKLLGRESVIVPGGTFNACKLHITVEERSNIAGVNTLTQFEGTTWTDARFGRVKQVTAGTSTVNAFGQSFVTQIGSSEELIEATMNGQHTP
jgi:hypothetical protein